MSFLILPTDQHDQSFYHAAISVAANQPALKEPFPMLTDSAQGSGTGAAPVPTNQAASRNPYRSCGYSNARLPARLRCKAVCLRVLWKVRCRWWLHKLLLLILSFAVVVSKAGLGG